MVFLRTGVSYICMIVNFLRLLSQSTLILTQNQTVIISIPAAYFTDNNIQSSPYGTDPVTGILNFSSSGAQNEIEIIDSTDNLTCGTFHLWEFDQTAPGIPRLHLTGIVQKRINLGARLRISDPVLRKICGIFQSHITPTIHLEHLEDTQVKAKTVDERRDGEKDSVNAGFNGFTATDPSSTSWGESASSRMGIYTVWNENVYERGGRGSTLYPNAGVGYARTMLQDLRSDVFVASVTKSDANKWTGSNIGLDGFVRWQTGKTKATRNGLWGVLDSSNFWNATFTDPIITYNKSSNNVTIGNATTMAAVDFDEQNPHTRFLFEGGYSVRVRGRNLLSEQTIVTVPAGGASPSTAQIAAALLVDVTRRGDGLIPVTDGSNVDAEIYHARKARIISVEFAEQIMNVVHYAESRIENGGVIGDRIFRDFSDEIDFIDYTNLPRLQLVNETQKQIQITQAHIDRKNLLGEVYRVDGAAVASYVASTHATKAGENQKSDVLNTSAFATTYVPKKYRSEEYVDANSRNSYH